MSITFGIYDFFSYTIPGVLYVLTLNHLLAVLRLPHLATEQLSVTFGGALLAIILAYALGQIMDSSYQWYTVQ
jgi:hypothetical protein